MERYISKFLVNGDVTPEPVGRSYGSISFAPREELIVFEAILTNPDNALAEISDEILPADQLFICYIYTSLLFKEERIYA